MSESDPGQNQWLRPADALQRLKAKKRALKARINQGIRQQSLDSCYGNTLQPEESTQKRINPFRCSKDDSRGAKRARLSDGTGAEVPIAPESPSLDQTLFEILRSGVGDVRTPVFDPETPSSRPAAVVAGSGRAAHAGRSGDARASQSPTAAGAEEAPEGVPDLPTDWGLKTNIRFLSKSPFAWTKVLKTLEEASAVTSCVRCLPLDQTQLDTSPNARLQRHALFWQHPWLPWLSLFPRSATGTSARAAAAAGATASRSLFTEPALQNILQAEWGESLRSLFQLLRSRQCPFFYVCAGTFCCLFRAAGVGGITDAHALITPTTGGLRQLLKRDDVGFSLPLRPSADSSRARDSAANSSEALPGGASANSTLSSSANDSAAGSPTEDTPSEDAEDDDDEVSDEDEDAERWLKRIGVAVPGMVSARRQKQQREHQTLDGRAASTALVQGGDVYALLNFLLNSRACSTSSGPLAGVPPTLLAPTAFRGASLQPLKVRLGTAQQGRQTFHSFELSGPVMPHAVQSLVTLVRRSHGSFSLSLSAVRATDALSQLRPADAGAAAAPPPTVFGQQGLADCGLDAQLVSRLCHPRPDTLRDVRCRDGLFHW